jgi:spore coat protein A
MQYRVSAKKMNDKSPLPVALRPVSKISEVEAVKSRFLTLNEYVNDAGQPFLMLLIASHWKTCQSRKRLC